MRQPDDPETDEWLLAAPMNQARSGHTATLLEDGRVLVVGGKVRETGTSESAPADVTEMFDPGS